MLDSISIMALSWLVAALMLVGPKPSKTRLMNCPYAGTNLSQRDIMSLFGLLPSTTSFGEDKISISDSYSLLK